MMDFITVPLTFGIVTYGIYKLFELFVGKKERLIILEKMNFDAGSTLPFDNPLKGYNSKLSFSFLALRVGCLLIGLGLGIILGIIFFANSIEVVDKYGYITNHHPNNLVTLSIASCVLFMGGVGLLLAFIIEHKCSKKKD